MNRFTFALVFAFACFSISVFAIGKNDKTASLYSDSAQLLVTTKQGKILGKIDGHVAAWKGIAYAQAPVGDLRMKAPLPPQNYIGIKNAFDYGASCPQPSSGFIGKEPLNENCLFLNVWSPGADAKKRPVMVWIHGGGFVVGTGASELYNGASLAKNGDVVVVTLNYRLGSLGFLYFDEAQQKVAGFDNNLGIRDQIAALEWVQQNIAAFGGDPNNVTIFGESAGGTSVETLLACRTAKGLFSKAIAESGPAAILWQAETGKMLTDKYLHILGVSKDSLHLLALLSVDTLKAAENTLMDYMIKETPYKVFSPTIDGSFITTDIFQCLSPAQSGNVALMIGTNKDEATMFASRKLKMAPDNSKDLEAQFFHVFKPEEKKRITAAYKKYPRKRGVVDLLTDAVFRIPAIRLAECQSKHSPVYMYRFEYSSFLLNLAGLRSFHGLEIPFVFGNTEGGRTGRLIKYIASRKTIKTLTTQLQGAWLNFARYGNPNGKEDTAWKPFDTELRTTMIFDRNSAPVNDPDAEQRKAWEGVQYY